MAIAAVRARQTGPIGTLFPLIHYILPPRKIPRAWLDAQLAPAYHSVRISAPIPLGIDWTCDERLRH